MALSMTMAPATNLIPPRKLPSIHCESHNDFNTIAGLLALLVYLRDPSKLSRTLTRASAVFVVSLFVCTMISPSEATNMFYLAGKLYSLTLTDTGCTRMIVTSKLLGFFFCMISISIF